MTRRILLLIAMLALAAALPACGAPPTGSGTVTAIFPPFPMAGRDAYYDMAFPDLATAPADARLHTHVCVVGTVESKRQEKDGDTHVKLCQGSQSLILEAIPEAPITLPRKGQRIRACGIQRWDGWHSWQEIHPLLRWEAVP